MEMTITSEDITGDRIVKLGQAVVAAITPVTSSYQVWMADHWSDDDHADACGYHYIGTFDTMAQAVSAVVEYR